MGDICFFGNIPQHHTGLTEKAMRGVNYALLSGSCGRTKRIIALNEENIVSRSPEEFNKARGLPWAVLKDPESGFLYAAITTGMGPSSVAIVMNELLHTADCPLTIIRTGTAGSMSPSVHAGDLVIATGAVRAESVSFKYAVSVDSNYVPLASPLVVAALDEAAGSMNFKHHVGLKITKDCLDWEVGDVPMSGEANAFSRKASDLGVLASSMESSVIYTMAARFSEGELYPSDVPVRRTVRCGTIVAILNEYEGGVFAPDVKNFEQVAEKRVLETALGACRLIHSHIPSVDLGLTDEASFYAAQQEKDAKKILDLEAFLRTLHPRW